MATAFDAVSFAIQGYGNSTETIAHTCTGTNRGLLVWLAGSSTADNVSGVTYDGVAMTRVFINIDAVGASFYCYALNNPSSGTHDIVASFSVSTAQNGISGQSFTGVLQSGTWWGTTGGGSNTSFQASPRSDSISTTVGSMVVDFIVSTSGDTAVKTVEAGQTQSAQHLGDVVWPFSSSYKAAVGTSTSMGWTGGGGTHQISHGVIELLEAGGASASNPPRRAFPINILNF